MTFVDCLVSETREAFDHFIDNLGTIKLCFGQQGKEFLNILADFPQQSGAFLHQCKFFACRKHIVFKELSCGCCQTCGKVIRVGLHDILKGSSHVFILKLTTWVVGPETKIDRIDSKDISCNLFEGIVLNTTKMEI